MFTVFAPESDDMEITFEKDYLKELYYDGKCSDKQITICNIIELSNHYKYRNHGKFGLWGVPHTSGRSAER